MVNPEYALRGGGDVTIASFGNIGDQITYINFDIPAMPSAFTIKGIAVYFIGGTTGARQLKVDCTWDGGTNFSPTSYLTDFPLYDPTNGYMERSAGGSEDLWGRTSWTSDELSNANFGIRLTANDGYGVVELDGIYIRVYYVAPAGYCNGSAVFADGIFNVENSQNAAGKPDGNFAILGVGGGRLEMDLTGGSGLYIPANTNVKVRWKKTNVADNDVSVYVFKTKDFSNGESNIGKFVVNSSTLTEQLIPIDYDTRYLSFEYNSSSLSIDAVTYSCGTCDPPAITLGEPEPVCSEQVSIYLPYSDLVNFNPADGNILIAWDSPDLVDYNYNGPASEHFAYIGEGVGSVITIRIPEDVSGTYTGTITLTNASGCISSAYPFTATINEPLPKPTIEVIEGSTEICEDGSVTFKATGAEGAQYIWYQGGYEISKGQTFSKEFGTPGEPTNYYTYEVTQALSDDIGNPLCESEKASIIVTHSRKPYGGYIQTSDKMCTGTTKSVTWFQNPDQGGTYQSSNTGVATVDENGVVSALSSGTADISYSLSGQGACSGVTVTSIERFDVYDNYAEITGNNGPICMGGTAVFYINAPEGRLLEYKLNDVVQPLIGTNQIIADGGLKVEGVTESVTLTLTAIVYSGYCTKELNQSSIVIVNPIPVTSLSPKTYEITEGASVNLTASGADSYSWSSVPAGFSSTDEVVSVTPPKNTTYKVTGTSNGCSSSDEAIIYVQENCKSTGDQYEPNNSMSGNLFSIPTDLTINANLLNAKDPDWYKLEISSLAKYTLTCQKTNTNTGSPSVELYGSNGRRLKSIDRAQPNSYNLSIGTYYIKVSAGVKSYLCYTLLVVDEGTGVGAIASFDDLKSAKIEPLSADDFKIWPNPTNNDFRFYNGNENPVQVRITDITGRTVEIINKVGVTETVVFGSYYESGLYFVVASENGKNKVFKVIKQ